MVLRYIHRDAIQGHPLVEWPSWHSINPYVLLTIHTLSDQIQPRALMASLIRLMEIMKAAVRRSVPCSRDKARTAS